jgi:hypothetical protein
LDYPILGYLGSAEQEQNAVEPYNFWQDFFDTYQSLSDWLKAIWLIVPPAFVLALIWLWRRPQTPPDTTALSDRGRLLYSV